MEEQHQRGRSPSVGRLPQNRIRHSPSPHHFNGHNNLDPTLNNQDYSSGGFSPSTMPNGDGGMTFSMPLYMNGNPQSQPFQHVLPSNDFSDPSLSQSYQPEGLTMSRKASQQSHHYNPNVSETNSPINFNDFHQQPGFPSKQGLNFENLMLDPQLQGSLQTQHQSINPQDIMSNMSSPQTMNTTPPNLMPPDAASSPGHGSPSSTHQPNFSPHHSRHASLDPSSAIFPNGQQPTDWQGMLSGAQFQTHRRAPSEHSDVSSSVAPSPYLAQQDSFEAFDQNPSPMLAAQPDQQMYQDALGIETFSLSDNQQQVHQQQKQHMQQQEGISPRHSPYPSPRMSPHPGFTMPPESQFLLSNGVQNGYDGQPRHEICNNQQNNFSQFGMRNESIDMGQAAQMAPPEINVELAPPSRDLGFDQPRGENDLDALSPPERVRRGRMRAKSDTYISRPTTPASPAPTLHSNDSNDHRRRSLSPFDTQFTANSSSRDPSPHAGKSRRSSTSSIPNRDYILELADPSRPPASGTEKRVQKHPATFQCTLCPKRFTRAYNLRSHLRTHTDERPFVCTVCGKAFARQHDRKRHEGLHSGEKKFVCRGELGAGGNWGCGRRFARADALGRHFRSEAGRICIKPLLDEEAAERQRLFDEQMMGNNIGMPGNGMAGGAPEAHMHHHPHSQHSNGAFAFPAALLAQYPALQGLQWDQLAAGNPGDEMDEGGVSGRSSFDASSGAESYFEEGDEGGYVSGPGTGFGAAGFGAPVGNGWGSDYEGR